MKMATISRKRFLATTRNSITPFLYQTRTLTASPFRKSTEANNPDHDPTPETSSTSITNNEQEPRPRYLQKHASLLSNRTAPPRQQEQEQFTAGKPPKIKNTMTRGEKQVFNELLSELKKSGVDISEAAKSAAPKSSRKDIGKEDQDQEPGDGGNEMTRITTILESVFEKYQKKQRRREKRIREQEQQKQQYKRPLTESDEAMRLAEEEEQKGTLVDISELLGEEGKQVPTERAIQMIVQRESTKIENALQAAIDEKKGDIGIWQICKARIFSILQQIDGTITPIPSSPSIRLDEQQEQASSRLEIPPAIPREPVVISLYPKMLLVAFRLLNLNFPNSPLISQFRSTIRSHGRASAVLGTSTGLYNELIYFYWRGCNDLSGVTSLLREMEVVGVEPNHRTTGILKGILIQRERDLKRHWYLRHQQGQERKEGQEGHEGNGQEKGNLGVREPWWDMAPNRRVVRELLGPEGWVSRTEKRVQQLQQLQMRKLRH